MEVFYGLLQLLCLCLWAIVYTNSTNGQSECTSGFMSRDRVRDLSRVVGGSLRTRRRQQRIIPAINFTCSGLINKWTVAAKWNGRHVNFPQLEIWRIQSGGSNVYYRVGSTLTEGEVENDSQIYEFVPSPPLWFQPGDILGIFNPDNPRLGIYYVDTIGPPNYRTTGEGTSPSTASFTISGNIDTQNDLPLITVDTSSSNGRSDCTNGFTSLDGILVGLGRLENRDRQQRIIPDINFTCDGAITKWIVAGRWNDGRMHDWYPDLQIWRSAGTNMFTKVGNSTLRVEGGSDTVTYYEYNLTTPLNFQAGDVLGIFQPDMGKNRLRVYFIPGVSPQNYYETLDNDIVEPPSDMFTLGAVFQNDFPLVAVEISEREEAHPGVCTLPPGTGQCKEAILRYFYNSTSEKCEDFIYGGCLGNDNNFETQESCVEQCITPTSITTSASTTPTVAGTTTTIAGTTTTVAGITTTVAGITPTVAGTTTTAAGTTTTIVDTTVVGTTAIAGNTTATNSTSSTSTVATATITSDHTSVSPLSTAAAATIGIAVSGTVILVVVLLLVVTFLLARKQSHSKQTAGNLYETPDAITMKENKAYRSNIQTQHIATAANEAYGHGGGIPVVQNVAYKPAAVNILAVQNEAYGHVSGAAVNTDTEEHIYVDITYDYYMN